MRLPTQYTQRTPLRFNITPLIDVVFLLIIFFLVASHFVRSEQAEAVELPDATAGEPDDGEALSRLTITIGRDGTLFIGGEPQPEASVLRRIEELHTASEAAGTTPELRLRGHRDGRYGRLRILIEHAAAHNIRSIRFAVNVDGER
ncbi:MAG: biopolymer transporter ExbD [Fuerstiella sp.]